MPSRAGRLLLAIAVAVACTGPAGASAATAVLHGSIGGGATFPERTLVLSAPSNVTVDVPRMYIWENGRPVDDLSVTPVAQAKRGDYGVELVIDQSASMSGAPLAQAMAAARAFAAQRTGSQELGVITFDSANNTLLPLTSNPSAIKSALSTTPWTGTGTRLLPAVKLALRQLAAAKLADATVIVLSDGAANGPTHGLNALNVGAAAQAQHARIFTVGLRDRWSNFGFLREISQLGGGQFVSSSAAQLPQVFAKLSSALSTEYLIRYRSILPAGERVQVKVHVDGVASKLGLSYYAAAAPSHTPPPSGSASSHSTPVAANSASAAPSRSSLRIPPTTWLTQRLVSQLPFLAQTPAAPAATPRKSFWTSTAGSLALAAVCALLVGCGVAVLLARHPSRRALQRRIGNFTASSNEPAQPWPEHTDGWLAGLLTRRRWWPGFAEQVQAARISRTPLELVQRWMAVSVLLAILSVVVVGSTLLAVLVVILAPFALRAWVGHRARRQRRIFIEQLPSHLQDLAGALRGGRSLVDALAAVAEAASEPMRGELDRALTDERLGLPLEETLEQIAVRMNAQDVEQVGLIAALHRSSGSNVAEALDRVAEGARERADLAREMRTLTGQARLSSWVLSGLPVVMVIGLSLLAPQYARPLFHTVGGIVLLVIAAVLVFAGWLVMNRIVNPEV